jgi:ferredoxin
LSEASRETRVVHGLHIGIDRDTCVGYADCIAESEAAFDLDDEGIAVFAAPESATREELLVACAACPVDAITVHENGELIVP